MSDVGLLRAVEAAAVRGWPAAKMRDIDGWLWRYASGGSIRANSVAALAFQGADVARTIAACEAAYGAEGVPCVFTVSEVSVPADLDSVLAASGYVRGEVHVTMAKAVDPDVALPDRVSVGVAPTRGWMDAYLSGLSGSRRAAAPSIIAALNTRAVYVSDDSNGHATSSGLTVIDGTLASVQCMATLPEARRQGGAVRVLAGIEAIAAQNSCKHLYLQTSGDNVVAQRLYDRCGYRIIGRYHTRTRP